MSRIVFSILFALTSVLVAAQPPTNLNIEDATMMVSGGYRAFKSLGEGVTLICLLLGSIKVFRKFVLNEPELRTGILYYVAAIFFALLFPSILDALFK